MALYHTYRPQSFSTVVGQTHIIKTISNQIISDKVAHAYLFFGPRGIGKTTTARLLAKAMNCTERKSDNAEPCNTCVSCTEIGRGAALDVMEIDAASHTGVDNVRENIIENAQFRPTKSTYKIFIIDEVHMLSTSAFNALLKTLEEPPAHVLFILATTELHKLPDTIISRCQRFTFSKISADILKKHLGSIAKKEGVSCEDAVLNHIVTKSEGCARDAVSLLEQVMATGEKKITTETAAFLLPPSATEEVVTLVTSLFDNSPAEALHILQNLYDQGIHFVQFTDDVISFLRTILIAQVTPAYVETLSLDSNMKKQIALLCQKITPQKLILIIQSFLHARTQIKQSPLPQLPLEILVITHTAPSVSNPTKPDEPIKIIEAKKTAVIPTKIETQSANEIPTEIVEEKPAKKSITKKVKEALVSTKSATIPFEEAKNTWPQFIQVLEKDSPSLTFILKLANLVETKGDTITIAVEHQFHRDKITEKNCIKKLEEMLQSVYKQDVHLNVILKNKEAVTEKKQELHELAAAFGGEVVS
jgi:DNA polymerase III subunit gamma/tau